MPSFFDHLFGSDPPGPSTPRDGACEECPYARDGNRRRGGGQNGPAPGDGPPPGDRVDTPPGGSRSYLYKVVVVVSTRAGDIPLSGLAVRLDGAALGNTDDEGRSPESALRGKPTAAIEVEYVNAGARLKRELFTLTITAIDAEAMAYTTGDARNHIVKVQDVFGSGDDGFAGDKDFDDSYPGTASMSGTDNPDIRLLTVTVKMATLSLVVPYLSQAGTGESVQTSPPTPAHPGGVHQTFTGSIICMPTSTKMALDYWGITLAGGGDLSRRRLMQETWDRHASPSASFPCPWQNWDHLRTTTGELADEAHPGEYSVGRTSAGTGNDDSIPSGYADGILALLAAGKPVVNSTYATDGHVMCIRGAVVDHDGHAQWLIFNDPYGNLASSDSVYGDLEISAPVGLRGTSTAAPFNQPDDVRAVREALQRLGHYDGPLDGPIDETDRDDPTVAAIRAFQGAGGDGRVDPDGGTERRINQRLDSGTSSSYATNENERNVADGANDRGRHVYYNGETEASGVANGGLFRLKTDAWSLVISKSPALTQDEVRLRLVPHA